MVRVLVTRANRFKQLLLQVQQIRLDVIEIVMVMVMVMVIAMVMEMVMDNAMKLAAIWQWWRSP